MIFVGIVLFLDRKFEEIILFLVNFREILTSKHIHT